MIGRRRFDLSEPRAFSTTERLWSLGLAEAPPGMLHYVMYPWVVDTEKLAEAGFKPRHSNEEALRETLEAIGDSIRLGRNRTPRHRLVRGAAAGVGLAGAALAARGLIRAGRNQLAGRTEWWRAQGIWLT